MATGFAFDHGANHLHFVEHRYIINNLPVFPGMLTITASVILTPGFFRYNLEFTERTFAADKFDLHCAAWALDDVAVFAVCGIFGCFGPLRINNFSRLLYPGTIYS